MSRSLENNSFWYRTSDSRRLRYRRLGRLDRLPRVCSDTEKETDDFYLRSQAREVEPCLNHFGANLEFALVLHETQVLNPGNTTESSQAGRGEHERLRTAISAPESSPRSRRVSTVASSPLVCYALSRERATLVGLCKHGHKISAYEVPIGDRSS